ncbi:MAG: hypothetical protein LUM44_24405 [Pyrinomonadaceae bacterium]|nr:hypothetical protein [Pyrinomonadaceae bacterium]
MNFEESQNYLYGLGNEVLAMKLGLENIRTLLTALENPEKQYLKVQIAGTNGKGSTVAFLESVCVQAGIAVGATVSPHLISVTERVRINGDEISEKGFARLATKIRETSEKLVENGNLETVPTYFEQVTAIALLAFAEAKVEIAILETGLGGRFDATTAANAEIVAITPVDLDHQRILGDTISEIAAEKAAIIRADTKVFAAEQKSEAEKVIYGKCRKVGVEAIRSKPQVIEIEDLGGFLCVNFKTPLTDYQVEMNMLGRHQLQNANLAILIAESLRDYGFKVTKENILTGIETAKHRGRLEYRNGFLFDGAHNISGAKALRDYLEEFNQKPITMIFGAMRDKDLTEIAEILFAKTAKLILTKPDNPRSMETEEILRFVPTGFQGKVFQTETVADALIKAEEISVESELKLVTGSLYLVGEAQKILKSKTEI